MRVRDPFTVFLQVFTMQLTSITFIQTIYIMQSSNSSQVLLEGSTEDTGCNVTTHHPEPLQALIKMRSTKGAQLARRNHLPDDLYLLVADCPNMDLGSIHDIHAPRAFTWSDITRTQIESHLSPHSMLAHTTPFLSAHIDPSRALECLPLDYRKSAHTTTTNIVKIKTRRLAPAWAYTQNDDKIPIWIEQGRLPQLPKGVLSVTPRGFQAFKSSCWICVDEVRDMLDMDNNDDNVGTGQWLACGQVPARMICRTERENEVEELDIGAGVGKGRSITTNTKAHTISRKKVPVRTSSLHSYTKEKRQDADIEQATEPEPPAEAEHHVEAHKIIETQQSPETQHATNVEQEQPVHHPIHPPIPPRNPHTPQPLSTISDVAHNTCSEIPAPLQPEASETHLRSNLPNTVAVRDFAPLPSIILTPPTPQLPLLYPAIAITSPRSNTSAAMLAQLEDATLRGAALKMWIEESRKKHQASTGVKEKRGKITRDIWSRE